MPDTAIRVDSLSKLCQRLIQHRRSELITQVAEGCEAYRTENVLRGTPQDISQDLDDWQGMRSSAMRQVIISPGEDGYWVAECPTLPGCISQSRSRAGAFGALRSRWPTRKTTGRTELRATLSAALRRLPPGATT